MVSDFSFSPLGRGTPGWGPPGVARSRSVALHGLLAVVVFVLVSTVACASAHASGGTVTRTFSKERSENSFVVPAAVASIKVVAVGGTGGENFESEGGLGARVEGELSVTPGQTLYAEVGYEGRFVGLNGGGSSDVRTAPRAEGLSPDDRLIVAGAGGGGGESAERGEGSTQGGSGGNAGDANGEEGGSGVYAGGGEGGTQNRGGFGGKQWGEATCRSGREAEAGKLETGGQGGECFSDGYYEGGQGGAGYYGGGGGAGVFTGGGGGGGSSLVPEGGSFSLAEYGSGAQVQISYTQPPNPPAVITEAASEIRRETATLNATVNPEDEEVTSCEFEYGTSESYGATAPCSPSPGSGITPVEVSGNLMGLAPETTYHYRIVATNANGTSHGGDETFSTPTHEPPEVTEISPEAGPAAGGETVTISGSGFTEATAVKFGVSPAKSFTVNSSESITAVTPAGTGTVSMYVTTPSGTSSGSVHFTFLPQPSVSGITPSTGPAAGGTNVKILGSGFDSESTVSFGASAALSVTFHSQTELTAVAPPGAETVYVTVTTPWAGTSPDVANSRFGYESGAPEYGVCAFGGGDVNEFKTKDCETLAPPGGKYRWNPGVEKGGFTAASSGVVTLETVSKTKVTCASAAITGTITSEGANGETIRFKGCASGANTCTGPGLAAGELTTSTLQGVPAWENKAKRKVVLALTPTAQPFMQYTCAGSPSTTVTGSILMPVKAGKMETSSKIKLKASKGKQKPESLEGGERRVLSSSTGGGPAEQTGLTLSATQQNEEAVEINPDV